MNEVEIDLVELIKYCWKKKKAFIIPMFVAALLLVGFCILSIKMEPEKSPLPNKYTSVAKILVRENSASSSISSSLSSLSSLAGINLNSGAKTSNGTILTTIATTNSFLDDIINKFNLSQRYKIEKNVKSSSRKSLSKTLSVKLDDKTNVLTVSFTDIDPVFAQVGASYATDLLMKKFFEYSAEDDAINLKNYREAMDSSYKKIVEYQKDIQALEQSVSNTNAAYIPSIMFDVQMKKMELEAEEKIYASYRGQYELLDLNMKDNPTTLKLIQGTEIPDIKSAPSRAKICIIAELAIFVICFVFVFFSYYRILTAKVTELVKEEVNEQTA